MQINSSSSIEDKVKLIEHTVVQSPFFMEIIAKIKECHYWSKVTVEPRCIIIIGPTGFGKTTLGLYYAGLYPRITALDGTTVQVLYSMIPSGASVKDFVRQLLEDMGDPLCDKGTKANMLSRLCKLIKACKVELIILDEFQHIIDRDLHKVLHSTADVLKEILNRTNVPIILMGLPSALSILTTNAQLRRRFTTEIRLKKFTWQTQEGRENFLKFLVMLEQAIPMSKESRLHAEDTAFRVFCATHGVTWKIKKLISRAAKITYEKELECITNPVLALAYDQELASSNPGEANPFLVDCRDLKAPDETEEDSEASTLAGKERGRNKNRGRRVGVSEILRK